MRLRPILPALFIRVFATLIVLSLIVVPADGYNVISSNNTSDLLASKSALLVLLSGGTVATNEATPA